MHSIEALLQSMTLEEKAGQLNMVASFRAVTGPGEIQEVDESIRLRSEEHTSELQSH